MHSLSDIETLTKLIGDEWKKLSESARECYNKMAADDKVRYEREMASYTPSEAYTAAQRDDEGGEDKPNPLKELKAENRELKKRIVELLTRAKKAEKKIVSLERAAEKAAEKAAAKAAARAAEKEEKAAEKRAREANGGEKPSKKSKDADGEDLLHYEVRRPEARVTTLLACMFASVRRSSLVSLRCAYFVSPCVSHPVRSSSYCISRCRSGAKRSLAGGVRAWTRSSRRHLRGAGRTA